MYLAEAAAALAMIAAPAHPHPPPSVTVQPGDTLSALSLHWCGTAGDWPSLAAASSIADPDRIYPGRRVAVICQPPPQAARRAAGRHRVVIARRGATLSDMAKRYCGLAADYPGLAAASGMSDPDALAAGRPVTISCTTAGPRSGYTGRHRQARRLVAAAATGAGSSSDRASYGAPGSFEQCVITRESGGNSQVMNSSGHYGLYQFSLSTWEAYGGAASAFGHASPAYQRQIFLTAIARGGQSNWSRYDGC